MLRYERLRKGKGKIIAKRKGKRKETLRGRGMNTSLMWIQGWRETVRLRTSRSSHRLPIGDEHEACQEAYDGCDEQPVAQRRGRVDAVFLPFLFPSFLIACLSPPCLTLLLFLPYPFLHSPSAAKMLFLEEDKDIYPSPEVPVTNWGMILPKFTLRNQQVYRASLQSIGEGSLTRAWVLLN